MQSNGKVSRPDRSANSWISSTSPIAADANVFRKVGAMHRADCNEGRKNNDHYRIQKYAGTNREKKKGRAEQEGTHAQKKKNLPGSSKIK